MEVEQSGSLCEMRTRVVVRSERCGLDGFRRKGVEPDWLRTLGVSMLQDRVQIRHRCRLSVDAGCDYPYIL